MQRSTTIRRFRPHPLYIIGNLWRYLFILLIPIVRGLYYVLINSFSLTDGFQFVVNLSNWIKGVWVDILVSFIFLSLGVLQWAAFTVEVSEDGLLVHRGIFHQKTTFLPASRYRCVSVLSPLRIRIFGGAYLRIDTPGGGLEKADLLIMLKKKDCNQIIQILKEPQSLSGNLSEREYIPRNLYVFVLAMITSNSFAGILLISTFVTQVGNILGRQFSEMIYGTFENVAKTLAFGIPPAAFAFACILFFGYLCAFVASLARHANFHVLRKQHVLEINAGLLTKRFYRVDADKIGYLDIRRSLLTFILRVYSVFLSTVGYGKFKDDVSALIPCVRKKQLQRSLQLLLPEYHLSERTVCPRRVQSLFRYTWRSGALLVLVWIIKIILRYLFPNWVELISWVGMMANFPLVWLLIVKLIDLNTAGISYEQGCYTLRYSKGFSLHQVLIRPECIVKVKRVQSLFQKRTDRCDVYIFSYSEGRQTHHVRDLDRKSVENLLEYLKK